MTDEENKRQLLFDKLKEYQHSGDPKKKEMSLYWRTGIGLQKVDGLSVSNYLLELAIQNIEGEITFKEIEKRLDEYHKAKRTGTDDGYSKYETYTRVP